MKAYNSYKSSEIDWIEQIPSHWSEKRIKYLFSEKPSTQNTDLNSGSISFGSVVYKDDNSIPESTKLSYQAVLVGEFLINPLNLNYDLKSLRTALSDKNVVVSQGYIVLRLEERDTDQSFFKHLLRVFDVEHMKSLGSGVRQTISFNHLGTEALPLPPIKEQKAIASFLDTTTSLIDHLIEKTQRKIELLKEKRTSIINEVVTKGLNSNAEMKDSGVEWIGEIPSDWTFSNFRYCIDVLTDFTANGSFASLADNVDYLDSGFSRLVRLTDLRKNMNNDGIYVSEKAHKFLSKSELKGGELLIANVGAYAGLVTLMPRLNGFFTLGPNMFLLKLNQNHKYFSYLLSSSICAEQLKIMAVSSAQPKLNKDNVRELKVVYPSLAEQEVIVSYLNEETQKIDSRIFKEEKRIDLLKEYRQSLISSVVTGKIKVTEDA